MNDIERAEQIEREQELDLARRDAAAVSFLAGELPVLEPIAARPVKLTAPEFQRGAVYCSRCLLKHPKGRCTDCD